MTMTEYEAEMDEERVAYTRSGETRFQNLVDESP